MAFGGALKASPQDYLVGVLLTLSYAVCGGQLYSIGFFQASWIETGLLTPTQGSTINSMTFFADQIVSPFLQMAILKFKLKPYITISAAWPLMAIGFIGASFSNSFWLLFVFNVIFIGLSMSLCFASCYNALFYFFSDDQLYLFSSAVLAGTGIGVLPECLIFGLFLETLGWKTVYLIQLTFLIVLIITSIILSPYFVKLLSIKSSVEKGRDPPPEVEQNAPLLNERSSESSSSASSSSDSLFPSRSFIASQDLTPFPNMSMTFQKTTELSLFDLFRGLFLNGPFVCVLLSFATGSSGFDGLMTHHPIRLLQGGISSGPLSLALNGCLQVVVRILVGITATRGILTPIRMSQLAKLSLAVSTILSNVFIGPKYQLFFYFFIGIGGGVINVADFLLIKDCVTSGRDLAAGFFCLANGCSNLPVIIVMGMLYQQTGSYALSYYCVSVLFAISICISIIYELMMKKSKRYVVL